MRKNRLLTMCLAFGLATAGMALFNTPEAEAGGFHRRVYRARRAPVYRRVIPAPIYRGYYVTPRYRSVHVGFGFGGVGYGYGYVPSYRYGYCY